MNQHAIDPSALQISQAGEGAVIAQLERLSTTTVSDCLGRQRGAIGLSAIHGSRAMVGRAFTVQAPPGDNLYVHLALDLAQPGDVLVVDGGAAASGALFGEIMMVYAQARGLAGFVADGPVRDSQAFVRATFPCYARSINLRGPFKNGPGSVQQRVTVGGMEVYPGDYVLGDADGVIAIRPAEVPTILAAAQALMAREADMLDAAAQGRFDRPWLDALIAEHLVAPNAAALPL